MIDDSAFHLINIMENETLKVSFFFDFSFWRDSVFFHSYLELKFKKFRGWMDERKVINSVGANKRVELQRGMPRTWKVLKCRSCGRKFCCCNILLFRIYNIFCVFFF